MRINAATIATLTNAAIATNGTYLVIAKFCRWYLDTTDKPADRIIFSRRFRYYLWCRDSGKCQYCGKSVEPNHGWHIEHIIPYSAAKDWPYINDEQNLVVACIRCNMAKGTKLRLPKGYYKMPPKFWRNFLKLVFRSWLWSKNQ
jgi:CRISPR/Cas system Type II protein with McrA/HNH and RuvC-like nuclease domain